MKSPSDYRSQAAECVQRVEFAKNSAHRRALLQQAQSLLRMADEAALLRELSIGEAASSRQTEIAVHNDQTIKLSR
jgi:hypothetical protein